MNKKIKKIVIITGISLVVLAGGTFATLKVQENMAAYEQDMIEADKRAEAMKVMAKEQAEKRAEAQAEKEREAQAEQERKEQTARVGGITYDLDLGTDAEETELIVIQAMHKMTHQKVRSQNKWGAIPMMPSTIDEVYEAVSTRNFENKSELLEIVKRWKVGDFSTIAEDHNYFWKLQDGTIGEAYGTLSEAEEIEFINNNFKKVAK